MLTKINEQQDAASMIVVMGVTGAGKSYFVNQLAGKSVVEEGADLDPCKWQPYRNSCSSNTFQAQMNAK